LQASEDGFVNLSRLPSSLFCDRRHFLSAGSVGLLSLLGSRAWSQTPASQAPAPLPPLMPPERLDGPPIVSARAWAIAEGSTGRLLWGGRETAQLVMASTTKIMTAHLVLQLATAEPRLLDEMLVVSERAAATTGSSARIRAGDRFCVRDLLYGLLLPSGNDAATAFAEHFGPRFPAPANPAPAPGGNGAARGDRPRQTPQPSVENGQKRNPVPREAAADAFVARMNREAEALGMAQTRYFDPHGLGRNHTSARDLTVLGRRMMAGELFRQIVRTRRHEYEVTGANGERRTLVWNNTNRLLDMEGYDGIKTGTTSAAGACLVASGRRGTDHLFVVVLGSTSSDGRYVDARNLFRWAWRERGHRE
jgi:serine-type D-Ala-D-Ala carboxypeptidase (penicillin-binding protein 5/6)